MAKGIGLIGNFRGKVGNMVGYNLKDSNNKQTQGVRVYQPVVKNPKSYGQAEQRAKLGVINATYRALKPFIDRGQEAKAYGNKSRLAWLSQALKAFNGAWIAKGTDIVWPALVPVSKGSLGTKFYFEMGENGFQLEISDGEGAAPTNMGQLSAQLIAHYPSLKVGDQITLITFIAPQGAMDVRSMSIVLTESTDTSALPTGIGFNGGKMIAWSIFPNVAGTVILSREGNGGEHLRGNSAIISGDDYPEDLLSAEGKETAIRSYMAGGVKSDWPEESIQG